MSLAEDPTLLAIAETGVVKGILAAFAHGKPVVLINGVRDEGTLVMPAANATPELFAHMARHACGLVKVSVTSARSEALGLSAASVAEAIPRNVSADALGGDHAPESIHGRCRTIRALGGRRTEAADLRSPGHVFVGAVDPPGVHGRPSPAEVAVQLCGDAGLTPAAVSVVLANEDGHAARRRDLVRFGARYDIALTLLEDVVCELRRGERVEAVEQIELPTRYGDFRATGYLSADGSEHLALTMGDVRLPGTPVHVLRECFAGDIARSRACDCREARLHALEEVARLGRGVIVQVRHRDRPRLGPLAGLTSHDCAMTADAPERTVAALILRDLGIA